MADCFDEGRVAAMYRLDAATGLFQGWFRGAEALSIMGDVARLDVLLALNSRDQPASCQMPAG